MLGWSGLKTPALALALVLLVMYGFQALMWHWEFGGPVKSALGALATAELEMPRLDGTVEVIATRQRIGSREIAAMLPMERMESAFLVWRLGGVANAAATAMGVDRRHHVVNAFLGGYIPHTRQRVAKCLCGLPDRKGYRRLLLVHQAGIGRHRRLVPACLRPLLQTGLGPLAEVRCGKGPAVAKIVG